MPVIIKFTRSPEHGTIGCTVGLAPHLFVGAFAEDAPEALHKAAALAHKLQESLNAHPDLAAALQAIPGAGTALAAISVASKALKYGHTIEDVAHQVGPKVASTVHKILSFF